MGGQWHPRLDCPSSLTSGRCRSPARGIGIDLELFGDKILNYNGWTRGANGLIPDVEQQVGVSGFAIHEGGLSDFGRRRVRPHRDSLV